MCVESCRVSDSVGMLQVTNILFINDENSVLFISLTQWNVLFNLLQLKIWAFVYMQSDVEEAGLGDECPLANDHICRHTFKGCKGNN